MELTQARLKEIFYYNPETGQLFHLRKQAGITNGSAAGYIRPDGYKALRVDGKTYLFHRIIFLYMTGEWPHVVDHIDRNRKNNKWNNLRNTSYSVNNRNSKIRSTNTSGYNGVSWQKKSRNWKAYTTVNSKLVHIGHYKCPTAAHFAVVRFTKRRGLQNPT